MTKTQMALFKRRRERILRLAKTGMAQVSIAKMLKITPQRVNQIIRNGARK
jgi:DNA-binding CsgD family transcriptional regulator